MRFTVDVPHLFPLEELFAPGLMASEAPLRGH